MSLTTGIAFVYALFNFVSERCDYQRIKPNEAFGKRSENIPIWCYQMPRITIYMIEFPCRSSGFLIYFGSLEISIIDCANSPTSLSIDKEKAWN